MTTKARLVHLWNSYCLNQHGNLTMILGLSALPLFVAAGAAIDYVRFTNGRAAFEGAVDSAAMALVTTPDAAMKDNYGAALTPGTDAYTARITKLQNYAKAYIDHNLINDEGGPVTVTVTPTDADITLTATRLYPTAIMGGFSGAKGVQQTISSTAKKVARPVEIALVMDTTGSMGVTESSSGKTYMSMAKTAASSLMSSLYGDPYTVNADGTRNYTKTYYENKNVRAALVPFSAAVRLDTSAYDYNSAWIDTTGLAKVSKLNFSDTTWHNYKAYQQMGKTWSGCVEARLAGTLTGTDYNVNDAPPNAVTDPDSLFTPYFAPDEPSYSATGSSTYYTAKNSSGTVTATAVNDIPDSKSGSSTYTGTNKFDSYNADKLYNDYIAETRVNQPGAINSGETKGFSNGYGSTAVFPVWANLLSRQENVQKYISPTLTPKMTDAGPEFDCVASKIVPMTYDRNKIESGITAMVASGATVIPEGLAWGWRAISPTEPFTKVQASTHNPAATISNYNDPKWRKIVVLMTDGENNVLNGSTMTAINALNGSWYSAYGRATETSYNRFGIAPAKAGDKTQYKSVATDANSALDDYTTTLCTKIKAQGVEIYTVAYNLSNGPIKTRLQNCATDADHFKDAKTGIALAKAFYNIGDTVNATEIYLAK